MSAIDDFEAQVRTTRGVVDSAVLAFQGRDARILDLIRQLSESGEISEAGAARLTAGITDLQASDRDLAQAVAAPGA